MTVPDAPWIGLCKEEYDEKYGYYKNDDEENIIEDEELEDNMLEAIIAKLCNYLGDIYGFDYEDLKQCCGLTDYEIERIKEIVEDAKPL
jgi:hypothetical protein